MSHEHVSAAAVLPDAPVIEFARSTEPHKPRKRMKARVVQKRAASEHAESPDASRRREPDERVWATHEGGGEHIDEHKPPAWDPEDSLPPEGPPGKGPRRPPRPPK